MGRPGDGPCALRRARLCMHVVGGHLTRNTTSRDQAPSHLAGTQMAHGTASRKQVGQGPYSLPTAPLATMHDPAQAPSAL